MLSWSGAQVQSLVGDLRSHKPCITGKKEKKEKKERKERKGKERKGKKEGRKEGRKERKRKKERRERKRGREQESKKEKKGKKESTKASKKEHLQAQIVSLENSTKHLRKINIVLYSLFQKEGTLPNSFYRDSITMILKPKIVP